jgi:membrane protein
VFWKFWSVLKQWVAYGIVKYQENEVSALSAQLTYYLILSFFPFLIFLITLFNYTPFSIEIILSKIQPLLATYSYDVIKSYIDENLIQRNKTWLSLSFFGTIWTASAGVMAMMKGLNKAYQIEERRPYWKIRMISLLITFGLGVVLLLSLVFLVFGDMLRDFLFSYMSGFLFHFTSNVIQYGVPILCMFIVFIWIYAIVPHPSVHVCSLPFKYIWPGAVFTTIGWITASKIFASYINYWDTFHVYGSVGGMIILLIWLYLSGIIILSGGQFNAMLLNPLHMQPSQFSRSSKYR